MYQAEFSDYTSEYLQAQKAGLREQKALLAAGKDPYPAVLDEILGLQSETTSVDLDVIEIPCRRIVGVKSAGRIRAFTASFSPLLSIESEFASKWINLCASHLDEGIHEPIVCYEYLGNFYVQEGNKRVSVLRHFGAATIPAHVFRVLPQPSQEPRIQAYYEFLDFYKIAGTYLVQFRTPGDYARLLAFLGREPDQLWTDRETRAFRAYYHYFYEAFRSLKLDEYDILPEEALLLWLRVYPFRDLGHMSTDKLKKSVEMLRQDFMALAQDQPVEVKTEPIPLENKTGLLGRIIASAPDHVNVAFIHPLDAATSSWVFGHDEGRKQMEAALADAVTVRSYFHADIPGEAERLLDQAVEDGADVVFTTTPQLGRATLRAAVSYPKVRFLNCSVDTPYPSIRTYYGRIYEAKFITGAIAGAMSPDGRIGYIGSYPIFGVPASINAFALGAQLTNPRAKIILRWSCQAGSHQADFFRSGIRVVSNRDVPAQDKMYLNFCNYGTYQLNDHDVLEPLASPCWVWGKFYENTVLSIMAGTWDKDQDKLSPRAVNYWWGMDSGMIDVRLSDTLPEGVAVLARLLREQICRGELDPFLRKIVSQDGTVINDGSRVLTADELLHMDWLCENVEGKIPEYEEIEGFARRTVRELGVHRDSIPVEIEEDDHENSGSLG